LGHAVEPEADTVNPEFINHSPAQIAVIPLEFEVIDLDVIPVLSGLAEADVTKDESTGGEKGKIQIVELELLPELASGRGQNWLGIIEKGADPENGGDDEDKKQGQNPEQKPSPAGGGPGGGFLRGLSHTPFLYESGDESNWGGTLDNWGR
jgi:hypothetical protein